MIVLSRHTKISYVAVHLPVIGCLFLDIVHKTIPWVSARKRNSIANTLELHLSCTNPPNLYWICMLKAGN